jgi:predicted Zn-dependent protease
MMPTLSIPIFKLQNFDPQSALQNLKSQAEWVGLRLVEEATHIRSARNGRPEENSVSFDRGVMVEVLVDGHFGYAGTSDLSVQGLQKAFQEAKTLAQSGSRHKVFHFDLSARPASKGHYRTPHFRGLDSATLKEFSDLLVEASLRLKATDKIVTGLAGTRIMETKIHYVTSSGTDTLQEFLMMANNFSATAQEGSESQTRTANGGVARCLQMGLEALDREDVLQTCDKVAREALELLAAPNCPSETMDLILAPDQMLLQIHESIGHPLELDRILGDERNYAGWSFVKPEDFGHLQYGSAKMNVTFDPSVPGEFASYAFDDCGNPAKREFLIENGLLKRGLGSLESQARLNIPGVANFRAASWNRAPIDRMANINLEPGNSSLKEMIAQTERGIYMDSNVSWSIDDYRNKFQFGCEYARLIENGKLTTVVKNPNYRGVTVPFWTSLKAVGSADEVEIFGSPWCGKGEPSQVIRVGHAAPPCLFEKIEVFGGGK